MSAVVVVSSLSVALVYFTVIWLSYKRYAAACKEKVNLAQVVLTVNPNVEEKKWDKVAYKMNNIFFQNRNWATPDFFFSSQQCQSNFREHILKPFLQGKVHPGKAESDVLISAVVSHLAGVHATLEEFLQTAATKPSLEFQCLPRDRHRGHFMSLWRFYHSGEASGAFTLPQLFMP
ncbi:DUP family-domain-containing protein [Zygosaccharomyces rouxii]|nr:DUP family-domain-containing protein [Zygosaccharomyces rouxii]